MKGSGGLFVSRKMGVSKFRNIDTSVILGPSLDPIIRRVAEQSTWSDSDHSVVSAMLVGQSRNTGGIRPRS